MSTAPRKIYAGPVQTSFRSLRPRISCAPSCLPSQGTEARVASLLLERDPTSGEVVVVQTLVPGRAGRS